MRRRVYYSVSVLMIIIIISIAMDFVRAKVIYLSLLYTSGAALGVDYSRRDLFQRAASAFAGTSIALTGSITPSAQALSEPPLSVLRSGACARGVGDACEDLAGDNEFIKNLQKKSQENAAKYDREALEAYNMKNFPDFMASMNPPKFLVKQPDGTFGVYTEEELAPLKAAGKIKLEQPMAKGGKYRDLTLKPFMVLKAETETETETGGRD